MEAPLWAEGASPWAHEREALAFVRTRLPNHEPYRAWSNIEFIADDGSVNEVDLLVVTGRGFFLVEIKSFPGKLFGDGQQWRNVRPDGRERYYDHPLILANTKSKRLKSLLARQKAFNKDQPPFITPLVFLSSPELECRLHDIGRQGVAGRDPDPNDPAPPESAFAPLPGVVAAIKDPGTVGKRGNAINRPLSRKIADAIEQAGIKPANRGRKAGDWELGELLDEGPGWQDFAASRPNLKAARRVRIYLTGSSTTEEEEQRLRREAEREFKLLESLRHDHVADVKDFVQADRGPALLFDRVDGEERLDLWAANHVDELPLDQRIELVRQLGEALQHAHGNRIMHRSLSARSVLVCPGQPGELPRLVIGHWQAGAREMATRLTRHSATVTALGEDLAERLAVDEQVYLAPETFVVDDPDAVALDVFSLGSLAFLLLTGRSPAADVAGRDAILQEHEGLSLASAVDGLPEALDLFVAAATSPIPSKREPISELLQLLDLALDELTSPSGDADQPVDVESTADPLSAHQGDVLSGGWKVVRRLGSGSTSVALLCSREGSTEPEVLKVAKDEENAERLRDEARALEKLRHAGIVELFGVDQVGGRTTLRLAPAGDPDDPIGLTLADRLNAQGRIGLDLLERFGDDLLEVVGYLESEGIAHRDIKPDNLGVRPRRGDRSLHLVLFDLSLSRTPDTSIGAGTPGYLDPFLAERPGKRWDPAADRYAAAATLHEMATGTRPKWGDGRTDPLHLDDEVPVLDPELFDPGVREPMVNFFERALHRNPAKRFDTPDQMRQAWRAVFSGARRSVTSLDERPDDAALDALAAAASPATPVAEIGLSGLAVSVLERRGISTVEQLLLMPTMEWNRASGVGLRVRREVLEAITRLRDHLEVEPEGDDATASIDRLAATLLPKSADQRAIGVLLGLDTQAQLGEQAMLTTWPSSAEVRAALDLGRDEYDELIARARARWLKQPPMTQVRNDVVLLLERSGGVLPGDEIAEALLTQRGSTASGAQRLARARAVVRAALETESGRTNDRFAWRRLGGGNSVIVALRSDELDAEELADYATNLGAVADQLVAADPLPSVEVVRERLRAVAAPTGLDPLPDFRLARLAVAASSTAAVSSRLEIYPRNLPPERALRIARAALLGAGTLSEADIRSRVRTRLPAAAPLPQRPQLDHLLDAVLGLEWFPGGPGPSGIHQPEGYRVPPATAGAPSTAFGASGHRFRTGTVATAPDEDRSIAEEAHERLERHARNGGYLVLTVSPRSQHRAIEQLKPYGPSTVDLDAWIVDAMRRHAAERNIKWDQAILAADAAGPEGDRWDKLRTVVGNAIAPLASELLDQHEHLLLTHPGLLARYERLGLLDELRERTRQPSSGQRLRTLWVLVPTDDPVAGPRLAGKAIPVTTAAEHMALPEPWLENLHHTTPQGATT
ncbi:MAG: BREX system serine/threonine kinase PglW [Ilumatobacter fluminis]|uniref:BREX system serine/threonine kinase PglW n=1 Tax=Ilumatobacter fluminis TaxID=467091 RepID=UPI0032EF2100